jgi:hypothetical protein
MPKLSLKAQNVASLSALTLFVLSLALIVTNGQMSLELLPSLIPAAEALAVTGVVAIWFSYLIPADIKHILVFFRLRDVLPGHRFIGLSEKDPRIGGEALENIVDDFAEKRCDPALQNQFWYSEIYRSSKDAPEVISVHKSFLLYRDMASVLLVCLMLYIGGKQFFQPLSLILDEKGMVVIGGFVCLFLIAANSSGKRFVTTAVAVYLSLKKI